jgi:hypothetical protein
MGIHHHGPGNGRVSRERQIGMEYWLMTPPVT